MPGSVWSKWKGRIMRIYPVIKLFPCVDSHADEVMLDPIAVFYAVVKVDDMLRESPPCQNIGSQFIMLRFVRRRCWMPSISVLLQ